MSLGLLLPPAFQRLTSFFWCLANTPIRMSNIAPVSTSDNACGSRLPASFFMVLLFRPVRRYGAFCGRLAEFVGEAGEQLRIGELAVAFLQHDLAKRIVAERHQDGGEVAHELVKCRGLRADGLEVIGPQAVEHGVAELVVDDVGGQAGEDRALLAVEPIELQRLGGPVVVGVLAIAGVRHDDQPVALERPADPAAEPGAALEEIQRVLNDRPDAQLMVLIELLRLVIENGLPVGRQIAVLSSRFQIAGGVSTFLVAS